MKVIAVHICRQVQTQQHPLFSITSALANLHPQTQFIMFAGAYLPQAPLPKNMAVHNLNLRKKGLPLADVTNALKWKNAIKKFGLTAVITDDPKALPAMPFSTFLYVFSVENLNEKLLVNGIMITPKMRADFATGFKKICCVDEWTKQQLKANTNLQQKEIFVSGWPLQKAEINSIEGEQTQQIEAPFFLALLSKTADENLQLLKAFSLFKKRLRSSAKLFVVAPAGGEARSVLPKLEAYKYRNDVEILAQIPFRNIEAPLAVICLNQHQFAPFVQLNLLQKGYPLVLVDSDANRTLFAGSALYGKVDVTELFNLMLNVYSYEQTSKLLQAQAAQILIEHTITKAANGLWAAMG